MIAAPALLNQLIEQENQDRHQIFTWIILTDSELKEESRDDLTKIYHQMLIERAGPGQWFQVKDGRWKKK